MTSTAVAQSIDQFRERFTRITRRSRAPDRRTRGDRQPDGHEPPGRRSRAARRDPRSGEDQPGAYAGRRAAPEVSGRIQFTPDLMPADIVGTNIVQEHAHGGTFFEFQPGPIFANVVLADEINRATPKTQSALLEAMQDVSVSVGKTTYPLEQPFLVLATQNPLEMEGTYPLPEAQLDRFFFKLKVSYPAEAAMHEIIERTTTELQTTVTLASMPDRFSRCGAWLARFRLRGRFRPTPSV